MKKNLAILHTEASLGWGGQEIRVFTEMKAMRARGHRCYLAAQKKSVIWERCSEAGFDCVAISEKPLGFVLSILKLSFWLMFQRMDVVNTHSSKDGWIGGISARIAGVNCIIRSRHIEVDYPSPKRSMIAFGRIPHHVITTSEKIRRRLIDEVGLHPEKITCVPTGIEMEHYSNVDPTLRKELGFDESNQLVGMVSVLRSWKGHAIFLEAVSEVLGDYPHLHILIAGEGPAQAMIEHKIIDLGLTGRGHLLGHREDVPRLLASLDLLVLPSTGHEGIPQIILQAHAAGCPVVASEVGGIPEVVEHGKMGRLVEPGNVEKLAQAIRAALDEDEVSREMAEAGRKRVAQKHSLEIMCQTLEKLYASQMQLQG